MKGKYHWSHACCTVIMSGIFTALCFFIFSHFFSVGEGKKEEAQMVKLQASEPTHIHTGSKHEQG